MRRRSPEIGCEHAGSSGAARPSLSRAAAIGMEACTATDATAGEDTFFNRVYDGVTVDYTLGDRVTTLACRRIQQMKTADPVPASDLPHQEIIVLTFQCRRVA